MDSYCENPVQRRFDDEIGDEAPPIVGQNERRMQVRAYNCWASLLGQRPVPRIADLNADSMPGFADHAVMLDFSRGSADPAITMLGAKLAEECATTGGIARLSNVPGDSLLARIADHYPQALANAAPLGFEAEFVNQRGRTLLYRGILLPFSGSGDTIEHILGVINWKELADPLVTATLCSELESAVAAPPVSAPGLNLGAWADGPIAPEPEEADLASRPDPVSPGEHLVAARLSVEAARVLEDRSRAALHAAIGQAWDFALAAQADPPAFHELAKLTFGPACERKRLAEVSLALAHAQRHRLGRGRLAGFLADAQGGLAGIAREERRLRRLNSGVHRQNLIAM